MRTKSIILFLFLLSSFSIVGVQARTQLKSMSNCLNCHEKKIHAYSNSVHRDISCLACHVEGEAPEKTKCDISFTKEVSCVKCHKAETKMYKESVHNSSRLPVKCFDCHSGIHKLQKVKGDKIASSKLCSQCHDHANGYFKSSHFKALQEGKTDAASCVDCHGAHGVKSLENIKDRSAFHTNACLKCHADEKMMKKNGVSTVSVGTYFSSFHGKTHKLGYPEGVAGCSDCHNAHMSLGVDDKNSSIHPDNVVNTCIKCHPGATASFTKFKPHADHHDSDKNPILYWTFIFMTGLLVGTFAFFWLHSILWAVRAFIEKRNSPPVNHHAAPGEKTYRRFNKFHIFMHLTVVTSFLGLAFTGLPQKFSYTPWGKYLIDMLGGTANAGLIHRICGVITFVYFGVALVMSLRFLFIDKKQKGTLLQKLFGPDSLFPNLRDAQDLIGMFKWFVFKGPKPTFERWTYWEKFDFLAVFWGVAVIGLSGLMLWFPVFFGSFLPGWVFNVATVIHSDEALLATGFIFTVHFFNTHFRPEKFPMDFVVFNGEMSKEEMLEERGDQWKRYEEQGTTQEHEVTEHTSKLWNFSLRIFGYVALFIGVGLAIGIAYGLLN